MKHTRASKPETESTNAEQIPRGRWRGGVLARLATALGDAFHYMRRKARSKVLSIHEGQLYRAPAMLSKALCNACRQHGIRVVIDFRVQKPRKTHPTAEAKALAEIGVRHFHMTSSQVPAPKTVEDFLKMMDDPANRPALIHCTHGLGRTGVFCAIYRMEYQGWSNEDALNEARRLGGNRNFSNDARKANFLKDYVPRAKADFGDR